MEVAILYFVQYWYEDRHFARVMASSRHLTRFGEGPKAKSYTYTRRVRRQNVAYMGKRTSNIAKLERDVELREDFTLANYQIPNALLKPLCGTCILLCRQHVEQIRRDAQ